MYTEFEIWIANLGDGYRVNFHYDWRKISLPRRYEVSKEFKDPDEVDKYRLEVLSCIPGIVSFIMKKIPAERIKFFRRRKPWEYHSYTVYTYLVNCG